MKNLNNAFKFKRGVMPECVYAALSTIIQPLKIKYLPSYERIRKAGRSVMIKVHHDKS